MTTPPEGWPGERLGQVWLIAVPLRNQKVWPERGPWVHRSHCPDITARGGFAMKFKFESTVLLCFAVMFYLSVRFNRNGLDEVGVSIKNIAATDLLWL